MPKLELPVPPPPEKFSENPYVEPDTRDGAFSVDLRFQVRYEQEFCCAACDVPCRGDQFNEPMLDVHHILPIRQGGTNDRENAIGLCHDCHNIFDYLAIEHNTSVIPILEAMEKSTDSLPDTAEQPIKMKLQNRDIFYEPKVVFTAAD